MLRLSVVVLGFALASGLAFAAPDAAPDVFSAMPLPQTTPQATPTPQRPTELSITLDNPGSHPKIGMQAFAVSVTDPAVRTAAETVASVLADDLNFEREFYVIDRKASAGIPVADTPQALPFSRWSELGADFVLMGSLREAGGQLYVDVRLISVKGAVAGRQDFGQSYSGCTLTNPRFCAHSIADDMHRRLRNLDGVARTRIAFTSDRDAEPAVGRPIQDASQGKEIYLMDYDGAAQRRLTTNRRLNTGPNWGPDGRMLAYASVTNNWDVFLTLLDGRPLTRPAHGADDVANHSPAISPDGTKIAFTSNRGGQSGYYDIWVVNRDGTNLHNLTPNTDRSSEGTPTWSPNGAQIAFTSDRTGVNQVFVMNADGTNVRRISFAEKCDRPTWSALNFIAYTLERAGGKDIAITDLSRGDTRILTDGLGSNEQPTVASNGRHIAFVTSRYGKRQIATIDYPDGKSLRQLSTVGNNTYPAWSPAPGGR
jgi:TolB protein